MNRYHLTEDLFLVNHPPMFPFWGLAAPLHNTRHDNGTLMECMKSYHRLALYWIQIMGECIDQETAHVKNFLPTFRKGPQGNDKEENELCKTESPCVPECSFLSKPKQSPHNQLRTSRRNDRKLYLANVIALYADIPKIDMTPFVD